MLSSTSPSIEMKRIGDITDEELNDHYKSIIWMDDSIRKIRLRQAQGARTLFPNLTLADARVEFIKASSEGRLMENKGKKHKSEGRLTENKAKKHKTDEEKEKKEEEDNKDEDDLNIKLGCETKTPDGLMLIPDFITPEEEKHLVHWINSQPWNNSLPRKTQHYGYVYDYRLRTVGRPEDAIPIPPCLQRLGDRLAKEGWMERSPEQIIINHYRPGQGISPHVDVPRCFGDQICSLSLQSAITFHFDRLGFENDEDDGSCSIRLLPRMLLVMKDEARYRWNHSIAARRFDMVDGKKVPRSDRISITFRTVKSSSC